jgi:broad specificity phosphatase PhoE
MDRGSTRLTRRGLLGGLLALPAAGQASSDTWDALRREPLVVLVRHALAPGTGDPEGFRLDDCRTQRNLDEQGRAQARKLGERFRAERVPVAQVLHSQWCRTRDTATLAFPGLTRDEAVFNSFFSERERADAQTRAATALLQRWRGPGVLVVVTHQVNISAITGSVTTSGEALVLRPGASGLTLVGRLVS